MAEIKPVLQEWVMQLPMMQQTVLLTAIRGPDGMTKYGAHKLLLRWFRRCVLLSAMDGKVLGNPHSANGGSFTGPSFDVADQRWPSEWEPTMNAIVDDYMRSLDALPMHFHLHLIHAVERSSVTNTRTPGSEAGGIHFMSGLSPICICIRRRPPNSTNGWVTPGKAGSNGLTRLQPLNGDCVGEEKEYPHDD